MNAPAPTNYADTLGLPALTLTAPWGTAIMRWGKPWENRGWMPPESLRGQRLVIHQGKVPLTPSGALTKDAAGRSIFASYQSIQRAGLCPVDHEAGWKQALADSRMVLGTVVLLDVVEVKAEHVISLWDSPGEVMPREPWQIQGGYAWKLGEPVLLSEPFPMKGLQKLWTVSKDQALPMAVRR